MQNDEMVFYMHITLNYFLRLFFLISNTEKHLCDSDVREVGKHYKWLSFRSFKPIRLHHLKESVRLTQNCRAPHFPIVQPITCSSWNTCTKLRLKEKKKNQIICSADLLKLNPTDGLILNSTLLPEMASASPKVLPAWPKAMTEVLQMTIRHA